MKLNNLFETENPVVYVFRLEDFNLHHLSGGDRTFGL